MIGTMFRQAERATSLPARSALYVPGDRPDRIHKALASGADAVVIDLEDAVAPDRKDEARAAVAHVLRELDPTTSPRLDVRCNRVDDGWDPDDVDVAVHPAVSGLRLAKAEDPQLVARLAEQVSELESDRDIVPGSIGLDLLIESARGVVDASAMVAASPRVRQLCLGGADLVHDLGADRSVAGDDPLLLARQMLVLASRAHGLVGPMDTVCTQVDDPDRVESEARAARALGYVGKSVIHPRQIDPVHRAFAPSEEQIVWAAKVQAAWRAAQERGDAATVVDGEFVDSPVAERAARILSLTFDPRGAQ